MLTVFGFVGDLCEGALSVTRKQSKCESFRMWDQDRFFSIVIKILVMVFDAMVECLLGVANSPLFNHHLRLSPPSDI
jgi:hypothetical protein